MDFQCLGPLNAMVGGVPIDLGEPQRRLVLAVLLTQANSVVSTDRLIDGVWGDLPPQNGRKIVQGYVSGLRRALDSSDAIESVSPGYRLNVKPQEVDSAVFEGLLKQGISELRTDPSAAGMTLADALALWSGNPYQDLADFDVLRPEITRLEQLHLTATEARVEADILSGDSRTVTAELADLTAQFPLRERFWSLRMLGLYRAGRHTEALRVFDEARRTLASEVGLEPSAELQLLKQRILDQDQVLDTPAAFDPDVGVKELQRRNPYKGLRPFDESDAPDFFGRDDLVRRLRELLEKRNVPRLIVLTGASGTGKSSVVRAGLVPELRREGWNITSMYPGNSPLDEFRTARDGFITGERSLIVIDQLEELFTLSDPTVHTDFLNAIAEAVETSRGGPWVLATIRSDFLGYPMGHRYFAPLLDDALVIVTPLDDHEVRSVITSPASRVGIAVEPALVAAMVQEVARRPTALPLLQFALTDLFDRAAGGSLTLDAYDSAGGIAGPLTERAEELYSGFDSPQRDTTRQLMLRLIALREDGEPLRRRVATSSLAGLGEIDTVMHVLGEYRLLTFDRAADGEATVEVAHEALLREWPRPQSWIDEASVALRSAAQLSAATQEWESADRADGYLLTGARLARLSDLGEAGLMLTQGEEAFLEASLQSEQELRLDRKRRRRLVMGGLAAAALVAVVFGILAVLNASVAGEREREARGEALAASARAVVGEDPELAVMLGIEALQLAPDSAAASSALREALQAHRTVFALAGDGPAHGSISPDGSRLAVVISDRTLEVWELDDDSAPLWGHSLPDDDGVFGTPVFTEDGNKILVHEGRLTPDDSDPSGAWALYDASSGVLDHRIEVAAPCLFPLLWGTQTTTGFVDLTQPIFMIRSEGAPSTPCRIPVAERVSLVAVDFGTGSTQDLTTFDYDFLGLPTLSADGTRYAVASDGEGGVYDFESNELIRPLPFGMSTLSADGALVLSGFNPMRLLEVDTGEILREYPGRYSRAHFSDSGRRIVAASFDESTRVFDTFGGQLLYELRGTPERDLTVHMTADERFVATFAGEGTVRVWDVGSQLVGTASSAVYGATDGGFVLESSVHVAEGYVIVPIGGEGFRETAIYDRAAGETVRTLPGRVVAVSPDESKLVMQSWPGATELVGTDGQTETFYEVGGFKLVGIDSGETIRDLDGPCVWYNQVDEERVGPECGDYPRPWVEWPRNGTFSPDGSLFAMGGYSGYAVVWDVNTGEIVEFFDSLLGGSQTLSGVDGWALVQFSPSGDHLAVHQFEQSSDTWILQRVNTTTWEVEAEIIDLDQPLGEMRYTPDGATLAVVDYASNLVLVDVGSWDVASVLEGPQGGSLYDVDVSPDGRLAATAAGSGVAWVWDIATESVVYRFEFPSTSTVGGLLNVEFVDDRTVLVSGESAAVLMTLDPQVLLREARDRVTRAFTGQECATYNIEPCPTSRESNS